MQASAPPRLARLLCLALSLLAASSAALAQAGTPVANPETTRRLEAMLHHTAPASPLTRTGFGETPFERVMLPGIEAARKPGVKTGRLSSPRAPQGSAMTFPGLLVAPTVPGVPSSDAAGVFTSAVADFDGASGPDVVTVQADGNLNFVRNDGKGNLSLSYSNASATALHAIVVYIQCADLNKDGHPDIVAMDVGNNAVLVFMNRGDGTFADATSIPVTPPSHTTFVGGGSLAVADVNGDGVPDIVTVTMLQEIRGQRYATVISAQSFAGKGDGTFQQPTLNEVTLPSYLFMQYGEGVGLADINGDHKVDLITELADPIGNKVYVTSSLGDGTGRFAPIAPGAVSIPAALNTASTLHLQDLNGDGVPDASLVVGDGNVYVARGDPSGTFEKPKAVLQYLGGAQQIAFADFTGDGKLDMLAYNGGSAAVYDGAGDGTFSNAPDAQYGGGDAGDQQPAPADFNGDGKLDFVWVDSRSSQIALYAGTGGGKFIAATALAPANTSPTLPNNTESAAYIVLNATGDVNGDGKLDVIASDYAKPFIDDVGHVYANLEAGTSDGEGHFNFSPIASGQELHDDIAHGIAPLTGDFNNDGFADVLIETLHGFQLALSRGDGSFEPLKPIPFPLNSGCTFNVQIGDLNKDGNLDILAAYTGNSPACIGGGDTAAPSGYFVSLGDGAGNFATTFTPFGRQLYEARLIDVDEDGVLDLVTDDGYQADSQLICANCPTPIQILRGKGDGTFDWANPVSVLTTWRISDIVPGDFDGDGHQDLTLVSQGQFDSGALVPGSQGIALLKGSGHATFADPVLTAVDSSAQLAVYADLNHSGKPDLVSSLAGQVDAPAGLYGLMVLENQGDGRFAPPVTFIAPDNDSVVQVADVNNDGTPDLIATQGAGTVFYYDRGGTSLALTASASSINQKDPVTLSAEVGVVEGTPDATGTVTFTANGAALGNAPVANGNASLTTTELPVGAASVVASYSGDGSHFAALSAAVTVAVKALPPNFSITGTPKRVVLKAGQSADVALALSANATFEGQITFACSGLPKGTACSFSPAIVSLTPDKSAAVTLTLKTTGNSVAQRHSTAAGWSGAAGGGLVLASCLWLWPRRKYRLVAVCLVLLAVAGIAGVMSGCGGDGNPNRTPVGTSSVTITATSGSGSALITQTTSASLTVSH